MGAAHSRERLGILIADRDNIGLFVPLKIANDVRAPIPVTNYAHGITSLAKFAPSGRLSEVPTLKLVAIQIHLDVRVYDREESERMGGLRLK